MTQQAGPPPGSGSFSSGPTGKQLAVVSWRLLRQDKSLFWLPFLGAVTALVVGGILALPGFALGAAMDADGGHPAGYVISFVPAIFGATIVSTFFQAAVVAGAMQRADGLNPTLGSALAGARHRLGRVVAFGALSATVGTVLRLLRERLGAVGAVLGALGGLAWGVATYLALPVLIAEDAGPITAVRRSSAVLKQTWGSALRISVRFGLLALLAFLPGIVVFIAGLALFDRGGAASGGSGLVLMVIGAGLFIAVATVFSAGTAYAKTLLYRYAVGAPTPGIDPRILGNAVVAA